MPYITDRIVHDADAHIFEPPGWFEPWVDPALRAQLAKYTSVRDARVEHVVDQARQGYQDAAYRARDEAEITLRKGFSALGAFVKHDAPPPSTIWVLRVSWYSRPAASARSRPATAAAIWMRLTAWRAHTTAP